MKRNAFFQLIHKEDGTYLKAYPAVDGGMPLKSDDILTYLAKKQYSDIDVSVIKKFVEAAAEEPNAIMKITGEKKLPENEYALITIDVQRYMAKLRLFPPSNEGKRLDLKDLANLVEQNGIKYGIIENNMKAVLKGRLYCTDILIAKAQLPVQGRSASIEYNFDVNKTNTPQMSEEGIDISVNDEHSSKA